MPLLFDFKTLCVLVFPLFVSSCYYRQRVYLRPIPTMIRLFVLSTIWRAALQHELYDFMLMTYTLYSRTFYGHTIIEANTYTL